MKSEGNIFDYFLKWCIKKKRKSSAKAVLRNGRKEFASSNVIWNLERFESIRMNIVYYEIKSNLICKSKNVLKVLKISILIKVLFFRFLKFSKIQNFYHLSHTVYFLFLLMLFDSDFLSFMQNARKNKKIIDNSNR